MLCWFYGVAMVPLAQAVALSFTMPLFATVLAALVLHETARARRWTACAAGFLGVLVILRPGTGGLSPDALVILVSALTAAMSAMLIKPLTETESPATTYLYLVVMLTSMTLVPAAFVWQWPTMEAVWLMLGIGATGTADHMLLYRAFRHAEASAVAPMEYAKLPLVALLAWVLCGETVDGWTWLGSAIIVGSTVYIAQREAALARRSRREGRTTVLTAETRP